MAYDFEAEQEMMRRINEVCREQIFPFIEELSEQGTDPNIIIYALLESIAHILTNAKSTPEEALVAGKILIEGFLGDWQSSVQKSKSPH